MIFFMLFPAVGCAIPKLQPTGIFQAAKDKAQVGTIDTDRLERLRRTPAAAGGL